MITALGRAARIIAPVAAAGIISALGYPAIAVAAALLILFLAAACWIINSNERTDRLARIILARQGNPQCLLNDYLPHKTPAADEHRAHNRKTRRRAAVRPDAQQSPRLPA